MHPRIERIRAATNQIAQLENELRHLRQIAGDGLLYRVGDVVRLGQDYDEVGLPCGALGVIKETTDRYTNPYLVVYHDGQAYLTPEDMLILVEAIEDRYARYQ